jgi:basic membrane protein A and related proteins
MKKITVLLLVLVLLASMFTGCSAKESAPAPKEEAKAQAAPEKDADEPAEESSDYKVGFIHITDPSDMGYTYNHDLGTQKMAANLGLSEDQVLNKFNIPEDDSAVKAALYELVEEGCSVIFGTSFGFEPAMHEVAAEYPEVEFCHATGFRAGFSELPNVHNYFGSIHEARYLGGIAAGLKSIEIGNDKLGYVAAMPFAEVISGFTAFYLGAKSVNPAATMDVMYTGSWNDPTKEAQNAQALIDSGAGVIGQHCDSTAPATVAEAAGVYHVGYNSDMTGVAPNASLTSVVWDWSQYLTYAVTANMNGEAIDVDWSGGLADGVCMLSALNESIIADGTEKAVKDAEAGIIAGDVQVFAGPLVGEGMDFDGNVVSIDLADGESFIECETASAPSWNFIVTGVSVVE